MDSSSYGIIIIFTALIRKYYLSFCCEKRIIFSSRNLPKFGSRWRQKKLATWLSDKNICSILVDREKDRTGYRCVCQARLHARITRRLIDKNEMKSLLKGNYSFYTTMIWSQLISNRNVCLFQGFGTVVCLSPKYWSVSICGDPHRSWHPFMKSLAGAYLEVQIGIRIFCCHGSYEQ